MALDGGGRIAPARVAWRRYGPEPAQARAVVLLLHGISGSQQALAPVSGKSILMRDGHPGGWGPAPRWIRAIPACWRPMRWARVLAAARRMRNCPPRFPTSPSPTACACRAVVARAGRCAAGCGGGLFLRRLSGVPVGARSARATRAGAGAGVRAARRRQLERRDRVAAPGRRAAGRRCLGARAVGRGAAGRLDALWPGPVVGRCRRARARAGAGRRARAWAARFSPWSMAALRAAACRHDVRHALASLRAPLYWLRCASDLLFPPGDETALPPCVHPMTVAGRYGHASPALEGPLWDACLRRALA